MIYWLRREAEENPGFALITSVDGHPPREARRQDRRLSHLRGIRAAGIGSEAARRLLRSRSAHGQHDPQPAQLLCRRHADGRQDRRVDASRAGGGEAHERAGHRHRPRHLNPAGCWEVLERSEAPVVLSHTSPRALLSRRMPQPVRSTRTSSTTARARCSTRSPRTGVSSGSLPTTSRIWTPSSTTSTT